MFEFGFISSITLKMSEMLMMHAKRNVKVYEELQDLVEDVTRKASTNVRLDNIENLFLYFGSFYILIFLAFLGEAFLFEGLRAINHKLVRYFSRSNRFRSFSIFSLGQFKIRKLSFQLTRRS